MSEEARRGEWADPRYREVIALLDTCRTVKTPGRRLHRICPHGAGVTVIVDPASGSPRNVACAACCSSTT
ncbi:MULTISPECIES: hypothetical protein [Streptomyces]|uniref:hypothetical protein n=1 Tax=Streptomyces TaxID=1883 RepID=UPI00368AA0C9